MIYLAAKLQADKVGGLKKNSAARPTPGDPGPAWAEAQNFLQTSNFFATAACTLMINIGLSVECVTFESNIITTCFKTFYFFHITTQNPFGTFFSSIFCPRLFEFKSNYHFLSVNSFSMCAPYRFGSF